MKKVDRLVDPLDAPSQYLSEVLKAPPSWILKWGQTMLLLLTLSLISLTHFVRYPQRVGAELMITTPDPVLPVISRSEGKISELLIQENQFVRKNQPLAIIHSPADYQDVLNLKEKIEETNLLRVSQLNKKAFIWLDHQFSLGPIQSDYVAFEKIASEYLTFLELKPNLRQKQSIILEIQRYQNLLSAKKGQLQTAKRKVELSRKDYNRHRELLESRAISDKEYEDNEQVYLGYRQELEACQAEISRINVQIAKLESQYDMIEIDYTETVNKLKVKFTGCREELKAAIKEWEEKYVLTASRQGRVVYSNFWANQSAVKEREEIFSIIPENQNTVVGQMRVPVENSGKIKVGQSVDIYLSNYPEKEFGKLRGKVISISQIPKKSRYNVVVSLNEEMISSYGIKIPFQHNMQGHAEIITQDMSLLDRIFDSILQVGDALKS